MDEVPATELDAVNVILINMGEAPINSLEDDLPLDASKAYSTLNEVSRSIQSRGWVWNRECVTLAVNQDGQIQLPVNALEVKSVSRYKMLTKRNGKLYRIEPYNNGYDFDASEAVEITYFLPFEDLPESAKRFITLRAARIFQARELGDELLLQTDSADETYAWSVLRAESNGYLRHRHTNNRSVASIVDRRGPVTGYFG